MSIPFPSKRDWFQLGGNSCQRTQCLITALGPHFPTFVFRNSPHVVFGQNIQIIAQGELEKRGGKMLSEVTGKVKGIEFQAEHTYFSDDEN